MGRGRWFRICLVGLAATLLAMGVVTVARQDARRRERAVLFTPLTAQASWEGDWELAAEGANPSQAGSLARQDRVTVPFTGTRFALRVRRGNYRGLFWVYVDGQPANQLPRTEEGAYLTLRSPDNEPQIVTLPVASGLDDGPHTAEIIADYGWDHWPLVGWQVDEGPESAALDGALGALAAGTALCLAGAIGCGLRKFGHTDAEENGRGGLERTRLSLPRLGPAFASRKATPWLSAAFLVTAGTFYASPWTLLTLISGAALASLTLLRLDLGLALVALSTPFYRHPKPLLGKQFSMAEIVIVLCAASWALRRAARREWKSFFPRPLSSADLAVILLLTTSAVSTLLADHRHVALRELRVVILEPAAYYLMIRTSKLDDAAVWRIVDAFVAGATAVALIGLVQYRLNINIITAEEGFRRLRSVYGSPNNAALYLGRAVPVLLAVMTFAGNRRRRLVYGALVIPVTSALLLSFSRAGILIGVPVSLLTLGVLAGGRWRWIALGLVAAGGLAAVPLLRTPRFAGLFNLQGGTLFFRLQLWRASLGMFRDHPWVGVGPDNFLYQYRARYILPGAWQEPNLSHAHNIVLTFATRLGLPGLVAGLWLHVAFWQHALPLRSSRNSDRRALGLGLMGSMAYALAHGLMDASFFFNDLALASLLVLGLVQSVRRYPTYE